MQKFSRVQLFQLRRVCWDENMRGVTMFTQKHEDMAECACSADSQHKKRIYPMVCMLKARKTKQQTNASGLFTSTNSPLELESLELMVNCSQFSDLADSSKFDFLGSEYGSVMRGKLQEPIRTVGCMEY